MALLRVALSQTVVQHWVVRYQPQNQQAPSQPCQHSPKTASQVTCKQTHRSLSAELAASPSSPAVGPQKEGTLSPYKSSLIKTVRHPEVVTLTESDVQRMKSGAHVMTAEERNTLRHAIEERKEHERAAAKARKEKMLRLQAEAKQQV